VSDSPLGGKSSLTLREEREGLHLIVSAVPFGEAVPYLGRRLLGPRRRLAGEERAKAGGRASQGRAEGFAEEGTPWEGGERVWVRGGEGLARLILTK